MGTILCYARSKTFFNIQYALSDNIFADFTWLEKEFPTYNIKFQKNWTDRTSERAYTIYDFDHSPSIYLFLFSN